MIYTKIDPTIRIRTINDLVSDLPVTVYVNKFTEEAAKKFIEDMDKAENSNQPVIPIVIDSYGGHVYSLLAMMDRISASKKPVSTIATGKAMSCGSVLLSCGKEGMRYISPNATVMIHEVSSGSHGKVEEIKADSAETTRLNSLIIEKMAMNCGHSPSYFMNIIHEKSHADWYLTPEDAVKHNLANKIHMPSFDLTVSVNIGFQ